MKKSHKQNYTQDIWLLIPCIILICLPIDLKFYKKISVKLQSHPVSPYEETK